MIYYIRKGMMISIRVYMIHTNNKTSFNISIYIKFSMIKPIELNILKQKNFIYKNNPRQS